MVQDAHEASALQEKLQNNRRPHETSHAIYKEYNKKAKPFAWAYKIKPLGSKGTMY